MKIAIVQDAIGGGGRIAVIIAMVEVLNEFNITPDIITFNFALSDEMVKKKYGKNINYSKKKISPNIFRKLPEFNKLWLNFITRFFSKEYDLFLDSNNTTCLMSPKDRVLSYTYYPRIDRLFNQKLLPSTTKRPLRTKIVSYVDRAVASCFYRRDKISELNTILTLSEFSKNAILKRYHINSESIQIIYPPVDISSYSQTDKKMKSVASIGRFAPTKKQLEQIKIAQKVPDLLFNIMGFAEENDPYFRICEEYIKKNKIQNVKLHRSLDYVKMTKILESSKFFLHTLDNEPFGITTVQGIAAGCIPIVPNSGGQVEVVPFPQFRYNSLDEVAEILNKLKAADCSKELDTLQTHINKFSEENFKKDFRKVIQKYLDEKNSWIE